MVRWMFGVSLKDRKRSVDLYSLLGVQSMANVMRHGRLRWFEHLERRSVDDWVLSCRKVEVAGARCKGRSRKTWKKCVDDDMEVLDLHPEWVADWRYSGICGGTSYGQTSNPSVANTSVALENWTFSLFSK